MRLPPIRSTSRVVIEWLGDVPEHWDVKRCRLSQRCAGQNARQADSGWTR